MANIVHRTVRKINNEPHVVTLKRGIQDGAGLVCDVYDPNASKVIHSSRISASELATLDRMSGEPEARFPDIVSRIVESLSPPPPPPR